MKESGWERELRERLHEIFVAEAAERLVALDAALLALEGEAAGPDVAHHLSEAFRQAHTLKGGARAAGLPEVERIAHRLEGIFERLRHGEPAGPDTWGAVYAGVDALRNLIGGRAADVEGVVAALEAPAAPAPPRPAAPAVEPPPGPPAPVPAPALMADAVRVPMARLESLMAEVRELHATLGAFRQRAAEARAPGRDDIRRLEHVAGELHAGVRRLRMVPVGVALAGLPRLVRDTAAACGKQAGMELVGESAEVDRSVLEGVAGALTHLVRNAVDHGLEEPARRAAAGKPAVGTVSVRAREERNTLVLEVADDGAGIDVDAVRRRGVELGLVSAEEAALAGVDIVFRPRFSTAGRITEVSGRGVGLDAVRATVESLQGSVAVATEPGAGTTFTVRLPLTLATTRCLVLQAAGRTMALPLATVSRVARVDPHGLGRSGGRAALGGPGGPVALAGLAAVLGLPGDGGTAGSVGRSGGLAVISATGVGAVGVLVDEIRGDEEIVVNALPPPLRRVRFTAGATVLGTGEVVPVLHAGEVFRAALGHRSDDGAGGAGEGAAPAVAGDDDRSPAGTPKVVVVADDSVTTRTLERVILESAGYDVRTAADGAQALDLVRAGGCDAVVCDVEMPVLDGFALCERLRADARFRDLPVVLVTALGSRSDRERGVAAGADAYIVKGEFDQETLLATLRRLL